jgi:hypothetical protein
MTTGTVVESPLSYTQEFLCAFGDGEESGPFGPRYHGVRGWRLRGPVDVATLRAAVDEVVARHEALRSRIVRDGGEPRQEVLPAEAAELVVTDLPDIPVDRRDRRAEELLNELEGTELSIRQIPHLRVVLARFDDADAVLAMVAHHVAIDGWSMQLLMEELAACYGGAPDRTAAAQYREYAAWQKATVTEEAVAAPVAYWRGRLEGARMLGIATDRQRPEGAVRVTSVCRFALDPDLTRGVVRTARRSRSTSFMVLAAAYAALLARVTGSDDVVVPTLSAGRGDVRFTGTVGPFFNFVPLRVDLAGCRSLADVLAETRRTCIEAQHHEIPFAHVLPQAPELMTTFADPSVAVGAFQTFQYEDSGEGRMGEVDYAEIRERTVSHTPGSDIPDGVLWTLEVDPTGQIHGNVRYDAAQFDPTTIEGLVAGFRAVLRQIVDDADAPLRPAPPS